MRVLTVFLTFLLILTACAAPAQPTMAPADVPVLDGTFESSLLVTEWKGSSEGNILFPLDPRSGTALSGYAPVSLGQISSHAFSPDRRTLAVVSFPDDYTYDVSLLLVDLTAWQTQRFELGLVGWVNTMVFSPDGKRLAIAHGQTSYKLTMVDIEQGILTAQERTDLFVSLIRFTKSGEALMVYEMENGMNARPPRVLLLDAEDLSPRWSAELEEIRHGIFPRDETVTPDQLHEPGHLLYLSPGLVFAPDQEILYIVHADAEQLTTVDFSAQNVETVEITTRLSWFERLLSLTAGVAHAKGAANGTNKQAVISPDGQFLYVIGVRHAAYQNPLGDWHTEQTLLGLEIIQTEDGRRVERLDTDAAEMSLSPDGRFLYLRNWNEGEPWTDIYDIFNRKIITRRMGVSGIPALMMNGQSLLTSTYSTPETSHHMSILEPDGSSILAEWTAPEYVWWLTTP